MVEASGRMVVMIIDEWDAPIHETPEFQDDGNEAEVAKALRQIDEKKYAAALEGYDGDIVKVGINYDSDKKIHSCRIEKIKDRGGKRGNSVSG